MACDDLLQTREEQETDRKPAPLEAADPAMSTSILETWVGLLHLQGGVFTEPEGCSSYDQLAMVEPLVDGKSLTTQ